MPNVRCPVCGAQCAVPNVRCPMRAECYEWRTPQVCPRAACVPASCVADGVCKVGVKTRCRSGRAHAKTRRIQCVSVLPGSPRDWLWRAILWGRGERWGAQAGAVGPCYVLQGVRPSLWASPAASSTYARLCRRFRRASCISPARSRIPKHGVSRNTVYAEAQCMPKYSARRSALYSAIRRVRKWADDCLSGPVAHSAKVGPARCRKGRRTHRSRVHVRVASVLLRRRPRYDTVRRGAAGTCCHATPRGAARRTQAAGQRAVSLAARVCCRIRARISWVRTWRHSTAT